MADLAADFVIKQGGWVSTCTLEFGNELESNFPLTEGPVTP